ncbi:MAG TPA: hypothetical protein VII06_13815 [Chloroflexota bacterium]|jgi:hypothetical protein
MDMTHLPGAASSPRPTQAARFECQNCGWPPAYYLKRGRCDACYDYWRKRGSERPAHLWRRSFTSASAERLSR